MARTRLVDDLILVKQPSRLLSTRHQQLARMRKAAKYASLLSTLSTAANVTDVRTQLEVTAYTSWITATLDFDLQNWCGSIAATSILTHRSQGGCDDKVRSSKADL